MNVLRNKKADQSNSNETKQNNNKKKILYEQRNKKAIAILEHWNTWLIFHATNTKSKNCAHTTILYFNVKVIYWTCIEFVCSFKYVCVRVGVRMCIGHSFVHDDDKKKWYNDEKNDHNAPKMLSSERILNENKFGFRRFQEHSKGLLNWYMNLYLNGRFWLYYLNVRLKYLNVRMNLQNDLRCIYTHTLCRSWLINFCLFCWFTR